MAEVLPFALLYTFAAIVCARMIWRRYAPAENGWATGITMALFVSLALAVGSTMVGEQWNWFVEGHRIGRRKSGLTYVESIGGGKRDFHLQGWATGPWELISGNFAGRWGGSRFLPTS